jgi:hypothetical protein
MDVRCTTHRIVGCTMALCRIGRLLGWKVGIWRERGKAGLREHCLIRMARHATIMKGMQRVASNGMLPHTSYPILLHLNQVQSCPAFLVFPILPLYRWTYSNTDVASGELHCVSGPLPLPLHHHHLNQLLTAPCTPWR